VFGPFIVWGVFQDALAKMLGDEDLAAALFLGFSAVALVFPYFLRRWVKRRNTVTMEAPKFRTSRVTQVPTDSDRRASHG
jgi:hypothetical protein